MNDYTQLINSINQTIKKNGNKEITGDILNAILKLIADYSKNNFENIRDVIQNIVDDENIGIIGSISPNDILNNFPDGFYLPTTAGTYTNMGGLVVKEGYFTIISKVGTTYKIASEVKIPEVDLNEKIISKNNLIDLQEVNYVINIDGSKTVISSPRYSLVSLTNAQKLGKYIIKGFKYVAGYSNYRLESPNGQLISFGNINTLTQEGEGIYSINITEIGCKLYLNVIYKLSETSNTLVNDLNSIAVYYNSIPLESKPNNSIIKILDSDIRQFIPYNSLGEYKSGQQISYNNVIYEAIRDIPIGTLPTNELYFKKILGNTIEIYKGVNVFNIKKNIENTYYIDNSGNKVNNSSRIIETKVAKVKLIHNAENNYTTYSINQSSIDYSTGDVGNNFYRIEDLNGNKIEGGVLVNTSESGGKTRIVNINQDVFFYHLIYFHSDVSKSSIPDLETYQIQLGGNVTDYEHYESIKSINGLPFFESEILNQNRITRYYNKRFLTAGDSITQGTRGGYVRFIEDSLKCLLTNVGSSGAKTGRLVAILTDIKDRSDTSTTNNTVAPNYALYEGGTIMIGTNPDTNIGSLSDIPSLNVSDYPDRELEYFNSFPNTYYGNLSMIIEWIKWKNPKFVINLVSPPYGGYADADQVFSRMKEIASYYSIKLIDATHESGLAKKQRNIYTYDGTHFNELGNEIWGNFLASKL